MSSVMISTMFGREPRASGSAAGLSTLVVTARAAAASSVGACSAP